MTEEDLIRELAELDAKLAELRRLMSNPIWIVADKDYWIDYGL